MARDWLAFCRPIFFSPLKLQATKSKCAERFSFFRVIRLGCKVEEFDCALAVLLGRSHGRANPCALHVIPKNVWALAAFHSVRYVRDMTRRKAQSRMSVKQYRLTGLDLIQVVEGIHSPSRP
jgi:hypothetical protein